jgi:type I restriction enzyme S subunit
VEANLKRYRASVLKAAVEGNLVPTEAELAKKEKREYEPASVLLERILKERRHRWEQSELAKMKAKGEVPKNDKWRDKYEEPATPDTSELPELPEGWCWTTIDAVSECLDHRRIPINKAERMQRPGSIPYYGANGQVGWIDDYLFDEPLVLVVEDETFIGRTQPFSYLIRGKSWVNNHAHVLRTISGLDVQFFNCLLAYYPFIPLTTGTTGRKKLTKHVLLGAVVVLPPLAEQNRIVEKIEDALSIDEHLEKTLDRAKERTARLRQSILRWAFEGKLVDQDPNDEPASVLLERIRSERESSQPVKTPKPERARRKTA